MTKTILFISPTGTLDNGAEISIVNLMKFLVKKGYRVLNVFLITRCRLKRIIKQNFRKQGLKPMVFQLLNGGGKKHRVVRQEIIFCE